MRAAQFLAIIGRGSKGSNALENTEDRAGATSEQQDNVINTVNSLDPYGPSWQLVPGNVAAGTVYAQVPTSGTGDLTFTRASTATRTDSAGNIVDVASGVGRVHYRNADGSLSSTGRLLLEPQRTNSIRNSTMVGAVAGSPGTLPTNWVATNLFGLTQTIGTLGTESGLQYIDVRFNGTANTTAMMELRYEGPTQIAALNSQVWTNSTYVKLVANPSPANAIWVGMYERNSVGTAVGFGQQAITPTTSLTRFTFTRTLVGGATVAFVQPVIAFNLTSGATYDFTIRIAAPQMELGAFASTFIPTTTAAVTRLADAASKAGVSSLIGQTEGTLFVDMNLLVRSGNAYFALAPNLGLTSNYIGISFSATNIQAEMVSSSVAQAAIQFVNSATGNFKIAFAYKQNDLAFYVNGVLVGTDTNATVPVCSQIGLFNYFQTMALQYNQAALFPTRLTNARLAEITTL
jgi:hypothetical protein